MSTFFNQNIYVTEEELEKTYNYIKNIMDSKISQIQRYIEQIEQKTKEKSYEMQPDNEEIKQQIANINDKINVMQNLSGQAEQLKNQIEEIKENTNTMSIFTEQELLNISSKIESIEEKIEKLKTEDASEIDVTVQLEQMAQNTQNKEQINILKETIQILTSRIENLEDSTEINAIIEQLKDKIEQLDNLRQENSDVIEINEQIKQIEKNISLQDSEILKIKNNINDAIAKQSERNKNHFQKLLDEIALQKNVIEAEIKEQVEEKLFNQNTEVQKVEQLLTSRLNKQSDETRKTKEEIEKIKLKIEEIKLEWKNSTEEVSHYEIEQINQKIAQIDKTLENNYTKREVMEMIEEALKKQKAELEQEYEEKIRKIVNEILINQQKEESKKQESTSQILAIIK